MNIDQQSFFSTDGDWYVANDAARGPWTTDACHAGPPTGLLARAAEALVTDKQLARLTATFVRPIPTAGVRIVAELNRDGRIAASTSLTMLTRDDKVCVTAVTTHIVTQPAQELPTPDRQPPPVSSDEPNGFVFSTAPHGKPCFANFVETKYAPGSKPGNGPKTMWMRSPALLEGEVPSPFQSVCPLADSGNGISFNEHPREVSCVNPDLTIALHRPPTSSWLASKAISHWESNGIGLAHATLYDEAGEIGAALQTLVLRRAAGGR